MSFKIVVNNGKAFETEVETKEDVRKNIDDMKDNAFSEESPYFDVAVLENGFDITDEFF